MTSAPPPKRRNYRKPVKIPISVLPVKVQARLTHAVHEYTSIAQDLGVGGACILTNLPLAKGDHIRLCFKLPNQDAPMDLLSEVRWAKKEPPPSGATRAGLQFLNISAVQEVEVLSFLMQTQLMF